MSAEPSPSLVAASPLGARGLALAAVSLLVSQTYSARPLRLSYRTFLAAPALGVAYVLVPYALGIVAVGGSLTRIVDVLPCALFALFVARIVLKDFRDRRGDALYGKPTLLLRHGKAVTCVTSLAALTCADALLPMAVHSVVALIVQPLFVAVAWMLWTLWRADDERTEQAAIGIGARLGNGLLLALLALLALDGRGAPSVDEAVVVAMLVGLFLCGSATLLARPQEAVIGYKG